MKFIIVGLLFNILTWLAYGQSLNGIYTVGGNSPDYNTLSDVALDLNTNGVSGPVIFNIAPGIYQEQISLNTISGTSATNTITFQSANLDSNSVTIRFNSSSNYNYLINIYRCNYIIIRGINFEPLNSTNKVAISVNYGSSYLHITNNLFSTGTISINNTLAPSLKNEYSNNRFTTSAGKDHIKSETNNSNRSKGTLIRNNIFEGNALRSIYLSREDSLRIIGNTISGTRTNSTIDLSACGPFVTIEKNRMNMTSSNILSLNNCSGTPDNWVLIRNNLIKAQNHSINVNYSNYVNILNNTLETAGSLNSSSIYFATNNTYINLFNNILSNSMGGVGMILSQTALISTLNSDYNVLYSSSLNKVKVVNTLHTITSWRNTYNKDLNSLLDQPVYVSSTDLHIDNCTPLNGAGTPLALVTDDFDGDQRHPTHPDIGADEFEIDLNTFENIAISRLISPNPSTCQLENQIEVSVVNHSIFPINSFVVYWKLFDQVMNTVNVNTTILPGDSLNVLLGSYDFNSNTGYNLYIEAILPNNQQDDFPFDNDYTITYYHLDDLTIYEKAVSDCVTEKELNIKSFPCESILWSTGETSRLIIVPSPGIYSVNVTSNAGCVLNKTITLN